MAMVLAFEVFNRINQLLINSDTCFLLKIQDLISESKRSAYIIRRKRRRRNHKYKYIVKVHNSWLSLVKNITRIYFVFNSWLLLTILFTLLLTLFLIRTTLGLCITSTN